MVVMPPQNSVNESEGRYLRDGFWQHGRFYGSWKPGKYLFPIDSEELNRLDIFHKVFLLARDNKPFQAPIRRPSPRIMDIGTGTGIWAINVAEECFSDAQIMAVDLNQIQPALIPPGVMPMQFDIEESVWGPLLADCDLIHMRMLLGSIQTDLWPQIYRKLFEHLTPGIGHLEHIEVDWTPRCDDDERPANSAFVKWAELFLDGMDRFNRSARVTPQETQQQLEAAGFTDVRHEVTKAYVCPWSPDRQEREIARWFNIGLSHSLEAMSLKPLIEKLGLKAEEVRELCSRAKRETCVLRYHTYCNIHVWTARKPGSPQ
uniref:Methyl transferase n=1 Tax=Fusarium babinda TaxID=48486 RepID=A0A0X8IJ66_9HYPO|nr:methyl transferase [Fusarium babinda]